MKRQIPIAFLFLCFFAPALLFSASTTQTIDVSAEGWEITGDHAVEEFEGQKALRVESARAYRRDIEFQDGTLEVDVALTGHRSFVYVQFRMQSDGEYEGFYLRSHKSNLPDAIQYTPVFRGRSNWQLYHGPGGTAAAPLPAGEWIQLRIEVSGRQAAVFVGDVEKPQLIVPRLAREPKPGYLALRGFVPRGSTGPSARFANLRVTPGQTSFAFPEIELKEPAPGVVRRWQVSSSFASTEPTVQEIPTDVLNAAGWSSLETEPSGMLVIGRHRDVPEGARRWAVLARLNLRAEEAITRRLDLGFSDGVTVFLNGKPLFSADDSYSFDAPRRQGLITLDQASVYLPLEKDGNELVIAITDAFGGWGLMGRFEDPSGIEIR